MATTCSLPISFYGLLKRSDFEYRASIVERFRGVRRWRVTMMRIMEASTMGQWWNHKREEL